MQVGNRNFVMTSVNMDVFMTYAAELIYSSNLKAASPKYNS